MPDLDSDLSLELVRCELATLGPGQVYTFTLNAMAKQHRYDRCQNTHSNSNADSNLAPG
jgi:hypothetical protein